MNQQSAITAFIATLIILVITIGLILVNYTGPPPSSFGIHSYLIDWAQAGHDSNLLAQRHSHIAAVASCLLFLMCAKLFAPRLALLNYSQAVIISSSLVLFCFCLTGAIWWCFQPISKNAWMGASGVFVLLALFCQRLLSRKVVGTLFFISLALVGLVATIPGLLVPYDASWMPPSLLLELQQGYSIVVSQCDQIALGRRIFEEIKPYYGILLSLILGLFERTQGMLTFGQAIQVLRYLQFANVVILFIVYVWYARRRPLPMCVTFMMVLPWLHTNQISLLLPNFSPWRNLGFPLAALILVLSSRLDNKRRALLIGITSGVCLAINQETGVAISAGMITFLYFNGYKPGSLISREFILSIGRFCVGLFSFLLLFYVFLTLSLGYFPDLLVYAKQVKQMHWIVARSGYFGGFRIEFSPFTTLVLCHYCYVLLRAGLSCRQLTERESFRTFASITGLVWLAYYFNRPQDWYFQPQYFLYGFLLIDTIRVAQSSAWNVQSFEKRILSVLLVVTIVIPQIVLSCWSTRWHFLNMIAQVIQKTSAHPDADLVSGILITKESAKAIKEKVNFLISERRKQQLLYFTGSSIFIPRLSGLYVMSYVSEPFMELLTAKQSDDFADAILRSQANEILFDAEESYLSGDKSRIACWKYIEAKIHPEFVYDRTTSGWKVFKRRSSSTISRDNTVVLKVLEP